MKAQKEELHQKCSEKTQLGTKPGPGTAQQLCFRCLHQIPKCWSEFMASLIKMSGKTAEGGPGT